MKKLIPVLLLLAGTTTSMFANKQIRGLIISGDDHQPLIGASVFVTPADLKQSGSDKASLGVITAVDGTFTISVPDNISRVSCAYVGYSTQQITLVQDKTDYQITLQPSSKMLETAVVTGYQTVERRKLTAAVSKVEMNDQVVGSNKSLDQALRGQVAGLQVSNLNGTPGSPAKVRIRGTASLNGTQDPLWVLDGIPLEGTNIPSMDVLKDIDNIGQTTIAGLNPADIDNITVLKDAAATAIYGARAANGVIVITTKKGKSGTPVINFSTKLTYTPKFDLSRLNLLNSQEKTDLELELQKDKYPFRSSKGEVYRILAANNDLTAFANGGFNALSDASKASINELRNTNTDWNDILLRSAFTQEYNLSLSGGSDKATYYTSVGYMKENANIPNVSLERFNMTLKTNYQVNKVLKLGASVFANRRKSQSYLSDNEGMTNPMFYARYANPYFRPYDAKGKYLYDIDIQNDIDTDLGFNPFEERNNTSNTSKINGVSSIFDAELRFNDNFKIVSQLGLQVDKTSTEKIADANTYAMRLENKNHRINGVNYLPAGGFDKNYENSSSQITWKGLAEYRKNIDNVHEYEIMAGSELRKTWLETLYSAAYGFDKKTLTNKPIIFPEESKAFPLHTRGHVENAYVSAFSTASYTLLNRYTVGGSIRFDGSDLFGVDEKYRYLPLYSVSALWRISKENFMKDEKWIDNLTLRSSYGLQGNIDKNTSPYLLGDYKVNNILPGGDEHMIVANSAPNDKLRWEKTHSVNAGLDFSGFNQAVNMSVDYYYRKGVDLIGSQMLPLETGFQWSTINWASMSNQGIEVAISTRNIHTKDFMWTTNFNFAYNSNKVLDENLREDATYPGRKGYPVNAIFVLKTGKVDANGAPQFITKDGKTLSTKEFFKLPDFGFGATDLTPKERREQYTYAGTSECPYTGGFNNTFTYKAFEVGVNMSFDFGGKVRTHPSYDIVDFDKGRNTNRDILKRWSPDNTNTRFPALLSQDTQLDEYMWFSNQSEVFRNLDIWVRDLNYVRLQSIRVAYHLPTSFNKWLGLSSGTVALEGRNLLVISSDYSNFTDPETMSNPYASPVPKSVTFSLNLKF